MTQTPHPDRFDAVEVLLTYLQRARTNLVGALEGLEDYDVRRPMTPTGTSLLGLVKHVASCELGYLGDCSGRRSGIDLPWDTEEGYQESADMWARAEESREFLLDLYRRSWAHGDETVRSLGLDAPATVPWWPEERRHTTVGRLVVHMIEETAQHAGHADILREEIDGRGGRDQEDMGDQSWWLALFDRVQEAADAHRG